MITATLANKNAKSLSIYAMHIKIEHASYEGKTKIVIHDHISIDVENELIKLGYDVKVSCRNASNPIGRTNKTTVIDWSNPAA